MTEQPDSYDPKSSGTTTINMWSRLGSIIASIAAIITLIIAIISLIVPWILSPFSNPTPTPSTQVINSQIVALQDEIGAIRQELDAISASASNTNPESALLDVKISRIDDRLSIIENAILDNPEKALVMTLFNKDLENINQDIQDTQEEMNRAFGLYQFLLGTIALGVFSLAFSTIYPTLRGRKENVSE